MLKNKLIMNDMLPLQYKEKQEWINWFTFLVEILPDNLSQEGNQELNKLFNSDFCDEENTLILTNLSGIELRKRLLELLEDNKDMPLANFIKKASLINKKGFLLSNSLPPYNHRRRREFISFLKSKFDFIESGDQMIIVPKIGNKAQGIIFLRNLSKIEFIRYPHFWNLINNCKEGNECKLVFCKKCNPEFENLFNEEQKKQINEILTNPPSKENIIYYPKTGSDYILKKFHEKFKGKENEHNMIIHWDWIIILNNPQAKYRFTNLLEM
jgi:hypothetical protein